MTEGSGGGPFHPGEQELQRRLGVAERMNDFGPKAIRSFMPQQHRDFYTQLPFVVVSAVDAAGAPWVSLFARETGLLSTPDDRTLELRTTIPPDDPVGKALRARARVGLLGIDLATRRRNRLSAEVKARHETIELGVVQSFGNCPQYIQTRSFEFVPPGASPPPIHFTHLSDAQHRWIARADTLFVGSYLSAPASGSEVTQGADASHRGGRPGFVKIDGDVLTVPEYPGNLHFNTMGNFLLNPKAGLCFVDFATGSLLLMTGSVELLWEPDELTRAFAGAERAWRFRLERGIELSAALPLRWKFLAYSPNTLLTGDWEQAGARARAERRRNSWRPYRILRVADEADDIRSFYLEAADGDGLPALQAGQFLTIGVTVASGSGVLTRTYTVSSSPGEAHLRISVKRERRAAADERPSVSTWLHENLKAGDTLEALAPRGDFIFDASERRPAVLLAGGIGITPMVAMARHAATEAFRIRSARKLTIIHVARSMASRGFYRELYELAASYPALRFVSLLTQPESGAQPERDFQGTGRLSAEVLQRVLPLDDYDFYLCGPGGFMQHAYNLLLSLGVRDARVHAEAFGPSVLERRPEHPAAAAPSAPEAAQAVIHFMRSGFEQRWNAGDATLLETAEKHGLSPPYSCRSGTCGSCVTKLLEGQVAYRKPPTAPVGPDEILLCCAVPGAGTADLRIDL